MCNKSSGVDEQFTKNNALPEKKIDIIFRGFNLEKKIFDKKGYSLSNNIRIVPLILN